MRTLPLFHDLRDRRCLVIGEGDAARRKAAVLESIGATVLRRAEFDPLDIVGVALVVVAEVSERIAATAFDACVAAGVPVNAVDRPAFCSVTWPAIVDRDPVTIAIGTSGAAPTLARLLRARIESVVPPAVAALASLGESWRARVKARLAHPAARARFWERFFEGPVGEAALAGDGPAAERHARDLLDGAASSGPPAGHVHLVGAGPGDPELLTLRAQRLIRAADVIVYDRLVSAEILGLARADAERVYVGKRRAGHCVPQQEIIATLVDQARRGRRVVRLKGGDPFVFGRGGEEVEGLRAARVSYDVTPGITAAAGCAAAIGVPLTHRDHARTCTFVAGHLKDGTLDLDWAPLAAREQTLCVYMGLSTVRQLTARLIGRGLDSGTPVAVVVDGTRSTQKTLFGTLGDIAGRIASLDPSRPAMILIGSVVSIAVDIVDQPAARALDRRTADRAPYPAHAAA